MSADVDAAREEVLFGEERGLIAALAAFEAAIRAEGLDVERLARALYRSDLRRKPAYAKRRSWGGYRDDAALIAAEYARLAEAER